MRTADIGWGLRVRGMEKFMYFLTGLNIYNEAMNIVEEYNPQTDTWISKTSMPTARHALGLVTASDGNIYAIGGFDGVGNSINTVEVYDPQTDTWMTGNSMPTARGNMGVVATNDGKIYVIGGITSTQFINIVE